jgi:hypothetical protein
LHTLCNMRICSQHFCHYMWLLISYSSVSKTFYVTYTCSFALYCSRRIFKLFLDNAKSGHYTYPLEWAFFTNPINSCFIKTVSISVTYVSTHLMVCDYCTVHCEYLFLFLLKCFESHLPISGTFLFILFIYWVAACSVHDLISL